MAQNKHYYDGQNKHYYDGQDKHYYDGQDKHYYDGQDRTNITDGQDKHYYDGQDKHYHCVQGIDCRKRGGDVWLASTLEAIANHQLGILLNRTLVPL